MSMTKRWLAAGFVLWLAGISMHAIAASSAMLNPPGANPSPATPHAPQRIVSLGGTVTEIVYELGKGDELIGNDLSSIYPSQATTLPRVGYYRSLSIEGLVSLDPDLILASEQAGPPAVLKRVQQLGIPVVMISDDGTLDSLYERIRQIALALNIPEKGRDMERRVRAHVDSAMDKVRQMNGAEPPVRAIMLMKRTSQMQAAGSGTTAAALLELAGLHNAVAAQSGYTTLSAESLAALQPDLIVTTRSSIEALGGKQAFSLNAGVNLTPAARHGNILIMDDLLILGFGPRTARSIEQLASARAHAARSR